MPNMRIVYDNIADSATLTANKTAGSTLASNLQDDRKGRIHRSTDTNVSYTLTWSTPQLVSCAALAFTNLSANASMRLWGYTNIGDTTPVLEAWASIAAPFDARADGSKQPPGVSLFAYGVSTYAAAYTAPTSISQAVITLFDSTNPVGYVEASRLIVGNHWSPGYNPDFGAGLGFVDNSKNQRSEAGDLLTDAGTRAKKLTMNLSMMSEADRRQMVNIWRGNGLGKGVFVSLFPEDSDPVREQIYMVYGKLTNISSLVLSGFQQYQWPLEIEEV